MGPVIESLESRSLLSTVVFIHFGGDGFGFFFGSGSGAHHHTGNHVDHHGPRAVPAAVSPVVQADLDKVQSDQQKLAADRAALAPLLRADQEAIRDAVATLNASLVPLRQALQSHAAAWRTTLLADRRALRADRSDPTRLEASRLKLQADQASARAEFRTDAQAIADAVAGDTTVSAARQKLIDDSKPIDDDLAQLRADLDQLAKDRLADANGPSVGGG